MENVVCLGAKWGTGNVIRVCAMLLTASALFACGGSSGGGGGALDPVDPPVGPGTTYGVSGTISGLSAAVQITDSHQTLDIAADGTFAFAHRYQRGDTFAISVNTGDTDQLCTLTHGSGLVLTDINDVSVDCLELRETNIRVSKPVYYTTFNQLSLRSSYQHIAQLTGEIATLVVAKNQFVTLHTSATQQLPVYAAFVKSFDETAVNALSTAVALVLLNPSIHNAIEEREAGFEFFADRFATLEAVVTLAEAIQSEADAGGFNLLSPGADLLVLLDAAVTAASGNVIASGASSEKVAAAAGVSAHKLHLTPVNGTQPGVSLLLQKLASPDGAGNNHELHINNTQQRHIAVESPLLTEPLKLAPNTTQVQLLDSADINLNETWTVHGPGAQAASAPVSSLLKQSVIDTASQFYAWPSLAFETGRLDLFDLRLLLCIDADTLQQIRDTTSATLLTGAALDSALQAPHYTAAYDAVTAPLRSSVVSHLPQLMECEYFRKGRWLEDHVDTAHTQIAGVLNITQAWYAPRNAGANVLVTPNLLAAGQVINTSMTAQQWQLSNRLAINVTQTRNNAVVPVTGTVSINEGETLQLAASCIDPASAQPVDCDLQWTAASGTTTAAQFSEVVGDSGNFNIAVSATDVDGAAASVTIGVNVAELAPLPRLRNGAGTVVTAAYVHDFGTVPVGSAVDATFELRNEGSDVLEVGTVGMTGTGFAVVSVSDTTLAPNETAQITLRFTPAAAGVLTATASIAVAGPEPQDAQTLQFSLRGTGANEGEAPLVNSYWLQQDGTTTHQHNIRSADVVVDTSDNIRQFRGFMDSSTLYPQISISLPQFSGAGSYALDDLISNRACLGFVAYAQSDAQWWCTKTAEPFAMQQATGSATHSIGPQGEEIVEFDFNVVPAQCAAPPCTSQHISGRFELP